MSIEKLTYLHGLNGSTSWRIEQINTYTQVDNDSLLFLLRHCAPTQFDDIDSVVHYLAEHAVLAGCRLLMN